MSIVLLTSIIFTTMVYSAFSTKLQIGGDLVVRSDNDIRVTNLSIKESTNGAYETYNNKYTKDTTSMFVILPSNSSITYEVEVSNKSDTEYKMNSLEELTNNNSNITVDTVLTNKTIFKNNTTSKYIITLSNNTSNEENISLVYKYNFVINNYYEEASEKFTLVKNNVSGYEGVYYFDENGDLDYGDGTKISLNMTSDIPKGVVSIWNNQAIYVCLNYGEYNYEYDTTKSKLVEREMPCLTDRYQNLVINGDLSYKSNYNLTQFGKYDEDGYIYKNVFSFEESFITDYIPIDMNKQYNFAFDIKTTDVSTKYYIGYSMYDVDKNYIDQDNISYNNNTLTELIKDLNFGDNIVYVNDLSNWNVSINKFNFWGYKDSTGYEYPSLSYTRYVYNSVVNKENNTIALSSSWNGKFYAKGTKISQVGTECGTYHYFITTSNTIPTNFTTYTFNNINSTNNLVCDRFRIGTKYIKFFVLHNYSKLNNVTTYLKNISIKEME